MRSILSAFLMETLILHKKSGETQSVTALVNDGTIFSEDVNIIIE